MRSFIHAKKKKKNQKIHFYLSLPVAELNSERKATLYSYKRKNNWIHAFLQEALARSEAQTNSSRI